MLTGTFADGLGRVQRVPDRIGFDPFPWHSMAIWIMTQMRRWGQLQRDVDYAQVAGQVFLALDAGRAMREQGLSVPASPTRIETIMGKPFDPAQSRRLDRARDPRLTPCPATYPSGGRRRCRC